MAILCRFYAKCSTLKVTGLSHMMRRYIKNLVSWKSTFRGLYSVICVIFGGRLRGWTIAGLRLILSESGVVLGRLLMSLMRNLMGNFLRDIVFLLEVIMGVVLAKNGWKEKNVLRKENTIWVAVGAICRLT